MSSVFLAQQGGFITPHIGPGFDRVTDFDRAQGVRINLRLHHEATSFADLRADASQFGTDTHLRLGDDAIVIEDVALRGLSADMFLF